MEHGGVGDINCNWRTWNNPQNFGQGTGRLGNKRANGDHPVYGIIKIGQNAEKNPEDSRRFVDT